MDPVDLLTVDGDLPKWPQMWDTAVRTLCMAPGAPRPTWPSADDLLTVSRAAQVRQPAGNNMDCGVCTLLSIVGTLLRLPRPGNHLSAVDRRCVAAMVFNRDTVPIMRLPSPGELPAAALSTLPEPHAPLVVADLRHQARLPDAQLQHALLCLMAAPGGL